MQTRLAMMMRRTTTKGCTRSSAEAVEAELRAAADQENTDRYCNC